MEARGDLWCRTNQYLNFVYHNIFHLFILKMYCSLPNVDHELVVEASVVKIMAQGTDEHCQTLKS